jgi:hypothetical protein
MSLRRAIDALLTTPKTAVASFPPYRVTLACNLQIRGAMKPPRTCEQERMEALRDGEVGGRVDCGIHAVEIFAACPFTVTKTIATFASLYGRQLFVHWMAGGFADDTPHDERHDRLVELATIVRQLTDGTAVTVEEVAAVLSRYVQRGLGTFILDEPESEADVENARIAFQNARRNILEVAQ